MQYFLVIINNWESFHVTAENEPFTHSHNGDYSYLEADQIIDHQLEQVKKNVFRLKIINDDIDESGREIFE